MSLIAHGGPLLLGVELGGASALVALGASIRPGVRRLAAIAAGATLAVAAAPPLHAAADTSVTTHMVQHLLLTMVAAPLAAIAFAGSTLQRAEAVRRASGLVVRPGWSPFVAGLTVVVVMATWHLPRAYDAAVDSWSIHLAEHATLLVATAWFWASALHHGGRRNPVGVIVALGGIATAGAVIGVLLMFAPTQLYASQRDVADGQIAGSLLAASGVLHGVAAFVLVIRALEHLRRPRPLSQATVRSLSVVVAGVAAVAPLLAEDRTGPTHEAAFGEQPAASAANGEPEAALGAELYRRDCAYCHGNQGEGTFRGVAISDRGTSSVFYAVATGRMPIEEPDQTIERGEPHYSPEEIDQLVAYTATFVSGPDVPALDDASVSLARGGELYRLHCGACHGATGIGGAQAFSRVAPSVLHATERETAAAVVAGPGGMPSFRSALDDAEVSSVAAYVDYLQDPVRRGIAIKGGRVGEGLVAWLVGAGALVVFSGWVARRS